MTKHGRNLTPQDFMKHNRMLMFPRNEYDLTLSLFLGKEVTGNLQIKVARAPRNRAHIFLDIENQVVCTMT